MTMTISYTLPKVASNKDAVVRAEVNIWTVTGTPISYRTVRTIASYFSGDDDALDRLGSCREVDIEAVVFSCLNIMRGPLVNLYEQQRIAALLAWAANRYSREVQSIHVRRSAASGRE